LHKRKHDAGFQGWALRNEGPIPEESGSVFITQVAREADEKPLTFIGLWGGSIGV